MTEKFIALSGGLDPLTFGHVRMIDDAAVFGRVVFLLNSDAWLMRKKGYVFMPFETRREIVQSLRNVAVVLPADDADGTVCESLQSLKETLHFFGNGGDRGAGNTPEAELCAKLGIPVIYGLGGGKVASSSELVRRLRGE